MALSQSTMLLFLETNSLLKYELMLPEEDQLKMYDDDKPILMINNKIRPNEKYLKRRSDPKKFFEYTHMDVKVFDYILECVRDKLLKPHLNNCKVRSAEDRLFITLRFMALGMSLSDVSRSAGIARSTGKQIIISTLTAIWETLQAVHLKPPTPDELPAAADNFFAKWKFPNAVGAIGAKFIPTKVIKPRAYNIEQALRKISLVLTAVADADFRFSAIDVTKETNEQKIESFDNIFANAGFRELQGSAGKMPFVILGNVTFPLKPHLLRPYHERAKYHEHNYIYNNRLTAARVAVEAAFQILTEKFTVFRKPIMLELELVDLVARTGCLLYNVVKDIDGESDPHFRDIGKEDKGALNLYLVKKKFGKYYNRSTALAGQLRDLFRQYIFEHNL